MRRLGGFVGLWVVLAGGCIRSPAEVPPPGEGGFISGTIVVRDRQQNTLRGVEGVEVAIDELGLRTRTNADGRFALQRLPHGAWRVRIQQRAEIVRERVLSPIRILFDGQTVERGELVLGDSAVLEGFVGQRTDGGGDEGIAGALVVLRDTSYQAVTNAEGRYRFAAVPQGAFTIAAFQPGFIPGQVDIDLRPGTVQTARDIQLEPGETPTADLSGTVLDFAEAPLGGVDVRLTSAVDTTERATMTTDQGDFTLTDVGAGVYTATFVRTGFVPIRLTGIAVLPGTGNTLRPVRLRGQPPNDADGDGILDDDDDDDDGDGCPDGVDADPADPFRCTDTDSDGLDDLIDPDDDNDGLSDAEELSPGLDTFITDPKDPDSDDDGLSDLVDACPTVSSADNDPSLCRSTGDPFGPLVLSGFTPLTAREGTVLEIRGQNFAVGRDTFVRFGSTGPGFEVTPSRVGAARITFTVPRDAASGRLVITNGGRTATTAESFTFLAPPDIIRYVPTAAQVRDGVIVLGRNFDDVRQVSIGETQVDLQPCAPDVTPPDGQQALCFTVPPGATTAPLRVETENGEDRTITSFVVLAGPRIQAFVPPVIAPGGLLRIVGEGFAGPASVAVTFGGGAIATSTFVNAREVQVEVPPNAATGVVTVAHPAGDAVSLDPLFIDNLVPAVTGIFPTLVKEGETLILSGVNLSEVVDIELGGGVRALPLATSNDGRIEVVVPAGAAPGPVFAHLPSTTATAPVDLAILTETAPVPTVNLVTGLTTNPAQTEINVFRQGPQVQVHDATTLAVLRTREITPGPQIEITSVGRVYTSPAKDRLVIRGGSPAGGQPKLFDVDPVALVPRAICDENTRVNAMVFYRDRGFFISSNGPQLLTQFNLTTGECSVVNEAEGGLRIDAMHYAGQGLLHVYDRSLGQAVVDIDPLRPTTFGRFVQSPVGRSPVTSQGFAWFGLSSNFVYGYGTPQGASQLRRVERLSPATTFVTLVNTLPPTRPVFSLDGRWVFVGSNSASDIVFDNLRGEVARTGPIGDTQWMVALPSPTGSRFVVNRGGLVRLDIAD